MCLSNFGKSQLQDKTENSDEQEFYIKIFVVYFYM